MGLDNRDRFLGKLRSKVGSPCLGAAGVQLNEDAVSQVHGRRRLMFETFVLMAHDLRAHAEACGFCADCGAG